ncbi:3262_t:CDS:2, partial [Acaulospora colombiana]
SQMTLTHTVKTDDINQSFVTERDWVTERQDLSNLICNLPNQALESQWEALLAAEAKRSRQINAEIRSIKDRLQRRFAELADSFEERLRQFSSDLAAIEGPLEAQKTQVNAMSEELKPFSQLLEALAAAEKDCLDANVEENDYTIFSRQDLEFELELVQQAIAKRTLFIENQLEQFESTFRYFDKDETNTLSISELAAALASLEQEYGAANFEAFINLLVCCLASISKIGYLLSFKTDDINQSFVTEMDLQLAQLSDGCVKFLSEHMPRASNQLTDGAAESGTEKMLDYERWLDEAFQEDYLGAI